VDVASRDDDSRKEGLPGHPKVAFGVARRNAPLVGPEELNGVPFDVGGPAGDLPMGRLGRLPARERDEKSAPRQERFSGASEELLRGAFGESIGIFENPLPAQSFRQCRPSFSRNVFAATSGPIVPAG
jgi:hypothetical protein